MIVQCELCSTRFKLDDSKLKDEGVRVRCSKCRHIFVVKKEKPDAQDDTDFDTLLNGLVTGGQTSSIFEEKARDKAEFPPEDDLAPTSVDTQKQEPCPSEFVSDDFSSDLSADFYHSDNVTFENLSATTPQQSETSPFQETAVADIDSTGHFSGSEEDHESAYAEVFSSLTTSDMKQNEESPFEIPLQYPSNPDSGFCDSHVDTVEQQEPSQLNASAEEYPAGALNGPGISGVAWDTAEPFSDENKQDALSPGGDNPENANSLQHWEPRLKSPDTFENPDVSPSESLPQATASRKVSGSRLPLLFVAISVILIIAVSGTGLYMMNKSPATLDKLGVGAYLKWAGAGSGVEGNITIRNTASEFVLNKEAGELFVITGEALNALSVPRASIQLKATLYDAKGAPLMSRNVFCGNSLTRDQLTTLPINKLEASMGNQVGDSSSSLGLQPGKASPFYIVFSSVPKGATEFGLEVVGSKDAGR